MAGKVRKTFFITVAAVILLAIILFAVANWTKWFSGGSVKRVETDRGWWSSSQQHFDSQPEIKNTYYRDNVTLGSTKGIGEQSAEHAGPPAQNAPLYTSNHLFGVIADGVYFGGFTDLQPPDDYPTQSRSFIQAVDLGTHKENWLYEIANDHSLDFLGLSETMVHFVIGEREHSLLYALDQQTGKLRWVIDLPANLGYPVIAHDQLFAATNGGKLFAVDLTDGKANMVLDLSEKIARFIPADDYLFVESDAYRLYSLPEGELVWARPRESNSAFAISNNRLLILDNNGRLTCTSFKKGNAEWQKSLPSSEHHPIAVGNGLVYTGTAVGKLLGFQVETGEQQWEMTIPSTTSISSLKVAGNSLFVVAQIESDSAWQMLAIDLPTKNIYWQIDNCYNPPDIDHDLALLIYQGYWVVYGPGTITQNANFDTFREYVEYIEVVFHQGPHGWPELGEVIKTVLAKYPNQQVCRKGSYDLAVACFPGAPFLLQMLGQIYRHAGHTEKAMQCFQRMIDDYGAESYFTGDDKGRDYFYAGGEGYLLQIETLRDYLKDYETALTKARELAISEYGEYGQSGWEWMEHYYKIALDQIDVTLTAMNAPLARWEAEYTKVYQNLLDPNQTAFVVLYLANKMEDAGETEKAIALFNLLRTEYREAYDLWGELGLDSPALSACESLIDIFAQQNRSEAEIRALEQEREEIYDFIIQDAQKRYSGCEEG